MGDCTRCHGLMVDDEFLSTVETIRIPARRCLNCGSIEEDVMNRNKYFVHNAENPLKYECKARDVPQRVRLLNDRIVR